MSDEIFIIDLLSMHALSTTIKISGLSSLLHPFWHCVDEFNQLRLWESPLAEAKDQEERSRLLKQFLNYLKRISKELKNCHIILATSESSMLSWLGKGKAKLFFFLNGQLQFYLQLNLIFMVCR